MVRAIKYSKAPEFPLSETDVECFIDTALSEDIGGGDVTCEFVIPADATLKATMHARQHMILAGSPLMAPIFKRLSRDTELQFSASDGDRLIKGSPIVCVKGNARALLSGERTALNILQHLSGIATLTRTYVDMIAGTSATLLDTRKTIPNLRCLAKYAANVGGAKNHRMGLYDAIMIKDNHIAVAGSVSKAVMAAKKSHRKDIQVECDTLQQVREAVDAGADSLLLDNMDTDMLSAALDLVAGRIPCEASGGINLQNIRAIAETGVDYISVGRLTQSAAAIDIGFDYSGQ